VENYKSLLDEDAVKKIQASNNLNANNELNETLINKFLELIAIKKGWLQKDTDADMERTAVKIINDFREQKFALMNLE
jgi:ribosome biogenesis GTPase A